MDSPLFGWTLKQVFLRDIKAGDPQGSVLLFLIYINDLPDNLVSNNKLFADDTSIFSIVTDIKRSCDELNLDLSVIKDWAFQRQMRFNPDPNKQATEVIFSRKKKLVLHPLLIFNGSPVESSPSQKHLVLILETKLCFDEHLNQKRSKANNGIANIKRLRNYLPQNSLLTIYKSFIRPHLDYGDVIYDQPNNESFNQKFESVQDNAALNNYRSH